MLHRIAFPVVSEWCHYHPRIGLGLRLPSLAPWSRLSRGTLSSTLVPVPVPGLESTPRLPSRYSAFSLKDRRSITSPDRCIAASGASVQSRLRMAPKYAGTIEVELRLVVDEEARSCKLSN